MAPVLYGLFAAVCGGLFAVQPVVNNEISRQAGGPIWAALISIAISLVTISAVALTGVAGSLPVGKLLGLPLWVVLGGVIGAVVVFGSVWLTPIIGGAAFFAWLIAGQLAGALVLDHVGFLGLAETPITLWRVLGVLMAVGGAVLVKYG